MHATKENLIAAGVPEAEAVAVEQLKLMGIDLADLAAMLKVIKEIWPTLRQFLPLLLEVWAAIKTAFPGTVVPPVDAPAPGNPFGT